MGDLAVLSVIGVSRRRAAELVADGAATPVTTASPRHRIPKKRTSAPGSAGVPSEAAIVRIALPGDVAAEDRVTRALLLHMPTVTPEAPVTEDTRPAPAAGATRVVVGISDTCPYGIGACWGGADEALRRLEGVRVLDPYPDSATSTAVVHL
jgi:hypothetical protein